MDIILQSINEQEMGELLQPNERWEGLYLQTEAIPPVHVFERSCDLIKSGIAPIWAMPYLIIDKNSDAVVGCCGFKAEPNSGTVEVGYNVSSATRGKGIATRALKLLSAKAFDSTKVMTVEALIVSENIPSLRVVAKCGFEYVKVIPDGESAGLECWRLTKNNLLSIL